MSNRLGDAYAPPSNNYSPSPIEALTSHSVEQRTLDCLLRIEALLIQRTTQEPLGKQATIENTRGDLFEVARPKGKGRK